jgi:hypothetical protein
MKNYLFLFSLLLFLNSTLFSQTEATPLDVELELFMSGVDNPVDIAFYNDTMFIIDQDGVINMAVDGMLLDEPFLSITNLVLFNGERGLLGMAFDPDFETNRTFYLNYINNANNTVIAAYKTYPDSLMADPNSGTILLTITQPFTNHNGGQIKFGPDGYLYIGMGDGGSANDPGDRSQDPQELLGKMLRYDVTDSSYSIPADNPFVGDETTLDDIWAIGLRNPWRFSFDKETGDLWIGDVGQNAYEEVDFQLASSTGGENYGWRCREGLHPFNMDDCGPASDYDDPIFEYSQGSSHCSVTGGFVYRNEDSDLLNGVYLGIDYCSGYLFGYRRIENGEDLSYNFGNNGFGFTTFGEDEEGELYVAKSNGNIYKVIDPCHSQTPILMMGSGDSLFVEEGENYYWFVNDEELMDWNQNWITASDTGSYYCLVENEYGCNIKSNTLFIYGLSIEENTIEQLSLYPNPFSNTIMIKSEELELLDISIFSLDGKNLWQGQEFTNTEIPLPSTFQKGIYLMHLSNKEGISTTFRIIKN